MTGTTPNVDTIIQGDCLEEMKKLPDISRNSRREQAKIFCVEEILPDALDEIERLRAENAWLKSDREFQSEEQAARISDLEIDELIGFDLERARGLRDFLQDDCAEVGDVWGEMIAEIERLRADLEQAEICIRAMMNVIDQQAARIRELEDALVEERARGNHYGMSYEDAVGDGEFERWIIDGEKDLPKIYLDRVRVEAKRQLRADGKIGPGDT